MRTWTWLNEDNEPPEHLREAIKAECSALMARWNNLQAQREMRSLPDCNEYEDDHDAELFAETAQEIADERGLQGREAAAFVEHYVDEQLSLADAAKGAELERMAQQQDLIVSMLNALGARLARPYEHWNEEERMMQYLEEDRWL